MKLLLTTTAVSAMAFSLAAAQTAEDQDVDSSEYLEEGYEEPAPVGALDEDELDEVDSAEKLNAVVLDSTTEADDVEMPANTTRSASSSINQNRQQTQPNASTTPDRPAQETRTAARNQDSDDLTATQRRQEEALATLLGTEETQVAGTTIPSTSPERRGQEDIDADSDYDPDVDVATASVDMDDTEVEVETDTPVTTATLREEDEDAVDIDVDSDADQETTVDRSTMSYADARTQTRDRTAGSDMDEERDTDRYASDDEAREGDMETRTDIAANMDTDRAEDEDMSADALTAQANRDKRSNSSRMAGMQSDQPTRESSTAAPGDVFVYTRTVKLQPTALNADRLFDQSVYSGDDEEVASITDFIIDQDGMVTEAVIEAGGLFGLGQETYTISFDDLQIAPGEDNGNFRVTTTLSEDQIEDLQEWEEDDFVVGENGMTLASELRDAQLSIAGTDETVLIEDVVMNTSGQVRSVIVAYDGENYAVPYDRVSVAEGDADSDMGYRLNTTVDEFAVMPIYIVTPNQSQNRNMFDRARERMQQNRNN